MKPTYQHDCLGSWKLMSVVVHKHRMEQHPHTSIIIIQIDIKVREVTVKRQGPLSRRSSVNDYKRHSPSYDAEVQLY